MMQKYIKRVKIPTVDDGCVWYYTKEELSDLISCGEFNLQTDDNPQNDNNDEISMDKSIEKQNENISYIGFFIFL